MTLAGKELFHYAQVLTGSPEAAEDSVQDLMVVLLEMGPGARKIHHPRAWLFSVLRRLAFRKHGQRLESFSARLAGSVETDPAGRLILEEAFQKLKSFEQEVVVLHLWEGLTFEEMADVLDVPKGTLLSRYQRAIAGLRSRFGGGDKGEQEIGKGLNHEGTA